MWSFLIRLLKTSNMILSKQLKISLLWLYLLVHDCYSEWTIVFILLNRKNYECVLWDLNYYPWRVLSFLANLVWLGAVIFLQILKFSIIVVSSLRVLREFWDMNQKIKFAKRYSGLHRCPPVNLHVEFHLCFSLVSKLWRLNYINTPWTIVFYHFTPLNC